MFYDNLKAVCDEKGLKVTPIVAECGGAKGSISNWKKGAMPNSEIVMKLSVRLNVSSDRLLFGTPKSIPASIKNSTVVGSVVNSSNSMVAIQPEELHSDCSEITSKSEQNDEMVQEIMRVLNKLSLKERSKLLTMIYDFEEQCDQKAKK